MFVILLGTYLLTYFVVLVCCFLGGFLVIVAVAALSIIKPEGNANNSNIFK